MSTVNISLPSEHISLVNRMVREHGFANRSEFFRSLLRLLKKNPALIETAATYPFVSPKTRSSKAILLSLKKTGKYSKDFLSDIEEGLKDSTYFTT